MAGPIDAVVAIHNAFRNDMSLIDAAALDSARGKPGLEATVERFRFMNEVLEWHAHGEELAIFPALEAVAPSVAEAYEKDHRALDAAFLALNNAVSTRDALETARATAAFKYYLDVHLMKEDTHLYRLIRERVAVPDQGQAVGVMASTVPQDRFPGVGGVDVPVAGPRRPREHDPHLADGHARRRVRRRDRARRAGDRRRMGRARTAYPRTGRCPLNPPRPTKAVSRAGNRRPSTRTAEPLVRVGDDFEHEYPGASALATECFANVYRAADLLMGLHNRHTADAYQLSPSGRQILAVVEGAGEPLEPSVIAERLLITTGSVTSLLDNLEKRGLIRRLPHPEDRRKLLIDITPAAQTIVDELLPSLHARERDVMAAALSTNEQRELLRLIAKVQHAALAAQSTPAPHAAARHRAKRPERAATKGSRK